MRDAFLSYNRDDRIAVERIAEALRAQGLDVWLDSWNLVPGEAWQPAVEDALKACRSCVVFVGPSGISPWQEEEMRAAIDRRVSTRGEDYRVIPVLLPRGRRGPRWELPPFLANATWVEFQNYVGESAALLRLIAGIRGVEPAAVSPVLTHGRSCPFRSFEVFDVEHARYFFGREALVEWLLRWIAPAESWIAENRFLAILGPSGSGKSSLARAGLVASIEAGALTGSAGWRTAILRPGPSPLETLAVHFPPSCATASDLKARVASYLADERTLHRDVRRTLDAEDGRFVLVVDQFEELFTLCKDTEERSAFARNLIYAAAVARGPTVVVLTLRADFYGECTFDGQLAAAVSECNVLVGALNEEELRRAIRVPCERAGRSIDPGLVEVLCDDARAGAGALPLLQDVLFQLWSSTSMDVPAYIALGRMTGAAAKRAETVWASLNSELQPHGRRLLLELIELGHEGAATRRRVQLSRLLQSPFAPQMQELVQRLTSARLLTTSASEVDSSKALVEFAHEAVITGWPRLVEWIAQSRELLAWKRRLEAAADRWKRTRSVGDLLRADDLVEALHWLSIAHTELIEDELSFIVQSRRWRTWTRGLLACASIAIAVGAWLAADAWTKTRQREVQDARTIKVLEAEAQLNVKLRALNLGAFAITFPSGARIVSIRPLPSRRGEEPWAPDAPVGDVLLRAGPPPVYGLPPGFYVVDYEVSGETFAYAIHSMGFGSKQQVELPVPPPAVAGYRFIPGGAVPNGDTLAVGEASESPVFAVTLPPYLVATALQSSASWGTARRGAEAGAARLPTAAEWEWAAVTGAIQATGWEWTATRRFPLPYDPHDGRDNVYAKDAERTLVGGDDEYLHQEYIEEEVRKGAKKEELEEYDGMQALGGYARPSKRRYAPVESVFPFATPGRQRTPFVPW